MNPFDNISPLDTRYYQKAVTKYLSEGSRIRYQLKVEAALARALARKKICSFKIAEEIARACEAVTPEEVYKEEKKINHDIRAVVNCIRNRIDHSSKPFVHLGATSYDIISTAEALRFKDFANNLLIPSLKEFLKTLIDLALREKNTVQIGRTHGRHAVPITFGFAMAEYVSRLGRRIQMIEEKANAIRGKFSGAVGAYNSMSLFFEDPEKFEVEMLRELGLKPSTHSTQIVEPEFIVDLMHAVVSTFGVIANLADDLRHLQRSEINEVAEEFRGAQVGSSTMPHKRNPWHFENVKSFYKEFMPRMFTVYLDQISEHQRDLSNSASSRFNVEMLAGFLFAVERMDRYVKSLIVDKRAMKRNLDSSKDMIIAEPLYLLLAAHGHNNAHEAVRRATLYAQKQGKPLKEVVLATPDFQQFFDKFTKEQMAIINDPEKYIGISARKTENVCEYWEKFFN
ncbi:MAG: lyase family protein [Candidatus Aenigmarchaeota archaeon]